MALSYVKRVLIGPPLPTHRLAHERLNKIQGLAVFSSDALSSSAYGPEEILLALMVAGPAALGFAFPVAVAITVVLTLVAFSYFQTVHAYPSGGGAYIVAHSNLGVLPGLVAAAALLTDYVLTVAVSVSAGIAAITSAFPELFAHRVTLALAALALIAVINMRGVRESGTIFSVPVYFFITMMFLMLVLGLLRAWGTPASPPRLPAQAAGPFQALTLFVVLRAFASGSASLTGVEAISNGAPAFRKPEARNAGITLIWMVAILGVLVLGVTFLARRFGIVPLEHETVVSQIARAVFGGGSLYYMMQVATALILILAANTSFADFPRLSSILARDRFLPRQLANLGDRLVFVNGIILLALLSGLLIYIFKASTHSLIPLYAVGVFVSFTLSQSGMVRKWWRERGRGWMHSIVFNLLGAAATSIVLVVVVLAKFKQGAWIVALLIPAIVLFMRGIWLHYRDVARQLTLEGARLPAAMLHHKVVVPVAGINRGVIPALRYAKSLSNDATAVIVDIDPRETAEVRTKWERWGVGVPLKVLESPYRSVLRPFLQYLDDLEWEVGFDQQLTVVLPEFVPSRWWHFLLHNQNAFMMKAALYFRRRQGTRVTVVSDVPYYLAEESAEEPHRLWFAGPTPIDRGLVVLVALLIVSVGGLIAAVVWQVALLEEIFGLAALVLLGLMVGLLFLRTLFV